MILSGSALIAASKRSVSWEHGGSSFWMSCSFLLIRLDFCLAGNMGSRYMTSTGSRSAGINSTLLPSVSFMRAAISFNTGCFFARRRASFKRTAITGFCSYRVTSYPWAARRNPSSPIPAVASIALRPGFSDLEARTSISCCNLPLVTR